jgi:hypothetical protein
MEITMKKLNYPAAVLFLLLCICSCSSSNSNIKTEQAGEVIIDNRFDSSSEREGKDFLQLGFNLLETESIGVLRIGMNDSEIIRELGKPDAKSIEALMGSDGKEHQAWSYTKKGIELGLAREGNLQLTDYIKIESPCKFVTRRNIGIGSTRSEVINAYKYEIDSGLLDDDPDLITAGSVYGGLIFNLDEHSRVSSIFIGAGAE